ncbi:MAG: glycosyltransferase [Candidatus Pacearchaeota archaeon]|jgi:glycosyltransferase involved in cell wall biosynthesis
MDKKDNFISVIIPAYNEEDNLPIVIASLRAQQQKNFEIIVVDNNSKDNTYSIAKKLSDRVYKCKEQGLSPARNYGAKQAKGNVLAFIDADCIASPKWIESINDGFKDKSISAMSGLVLHKFKNPLKNVYINSIFYYQFVYSKVAGKFHHFILTSPNIAIKKDIFNKIKGFKKIICEDIYLSKELSKISGIKIKIDSRMKVYCSTRRLDKEGFFKTLNYWAFAHLKKVDASNYALNYKSKD